MFEFSTFTDGFTFDDETKLFVLKWTYTYTRIYNYNRISFDILTRLILFVFTNTTYIMSFTVILLLIL